jgi:hypothetical protein|nr:MAG TPA: hypothetical protein [Caudoviricetes sp.]
MINYEHIAAGALVAAEFSKELRELCARYDKKFREAVPENISGILENILERKVLRVQLCEGYTKEELIRDGFEYKFESNTTVYYTLIYQGIEVIASVEKQEAYRR